TRLVSDWSSDVCSSDLGAVGGTTDLTSLTTDAAGSTDLNGGIVKTTGAQTYNDAVTLSAATTLTSTGAGNVGFAKTVDGAFSLRSEERRVGEERRVRGV